MLGFSEQYNLCQDWVLQFRLSLDGELVKSNRIIAEYLTGQSRDDLERRRVPLYLRILLLCCGIFGVPAILVFLGLQCCVRARCMQLVQRIS